MKKLSANGHVFPNAGFLCPADPMGMKIFSLTELLISLNWQHCTDHRELNSLPKQF